MHTQIFHKDSIFQKQRTIVFVELERGLKQSPVNTSCSQTEKQPFSIDYRERGSHASITRTGYREQQGRMKGTWALYYMRGNSQTRPNYR